LKHRQKEKSSKKKNDPAKNSVGKKRKKESEFRHLQKKETTSNPNESKRES